MSFTIHTFETRTDSQGTGFAFQEDLAEGQKLYFLARFDSETTQTSDIAEGVFGAIYDYCVTHPEMPIYDRFEQALKAGNEVARGMSHFWTSPPDFVVAYFDFHQLYLSQSGRSESYMIREGVLNQIIEDRVNGEDIFCNILNGEISTGDFLLFCSDRILRYVTNNQLVDFFANNTCMDAANRLKQELLTGTKDQILVTILGIGTQEAIPSAGFASRQVTPSVQPEASTPSEPIDPSIPIDAYDELPEENVSSEVSGAEVAFRPSSEESPKRISYRELFRHQTSKLSGLLVHKKKLFFLAGILLVLFVFFVTFKALSGPSKAEQALQAELTIAKEALQQADIMTQQGDRVEANRYISRADEALQKILKADSKLLRNDAQFLAVQIEDRRLRVENAQKVNPILVADLSIKNDKVDARGILELGGAYYVYDEHFLYKTIREVVEKGLSIAGQENILSAATNSRQKVQMFLTDAPRIIEYQEGVVTPMKTQDETWQKGTDINSFGSRFVYLLDPTKNQIWKYERKRSSYGRATPYNTKNVDLSRAISFAIDGAIYVLNDDGNILKFYQGILQNYELKDKPYAPFSGKNLRLYTTTDSGYLYILDPSNQRLMVFEKGASAATYKKQILYQLPKVVDFWVNDEGTRATLVTSDKIYEITL